MFDIRNNVFQDFNVRKWKKFDTDHLFLVTYYMPIHAESIILKFQDCLGSDVGVFLAMMQML